MILYITEKGNLFMLKNYLIKFNVDVTVNGDVKGGLRKQSLLEPPHKDVLVGVIHGC